MHPVEHLGAWSLPAVGRTRVQGTEGQAGAPCGHGTRRGRFGARVRTERTSLAFGCGSRVEGAHDTEHAGSSRGALLVSFLPVIGLPIPISRSLRLRQLPRSTGAPQFWDIMRTFQTWTNGSSSTIHTRLLGICNLHSAIQAARVQNSRPGAASSRAGGDERPSPVPGSHGVCFLDEPAPLLMALPWELENIPFNQYCGVAD